MNPDCYPISILPHTSKLFLDFLERPEALTPFYVTGAYADGWGTDLNETGVEFPAEKRQALADLLAEQNRSYNAGPQVMANIERLRAGASAVITGQQVVLFGGPLLTLLKAATAIRKAQDATAAGHPQVPIFWLASEDHDLAEADQVVLPSRHELHTLRLNDANAHSAVPVGSVAIGDSITALLDEAETLLGPSPAMDDLRRAYAPNTDAAAPTYASSFARWISTVFAAHGLIVIDASSRAFHALGVETLRKAITDADTLNAKLIARDRELAAAGYHSQVLVTPDASLLFLIESTTGARQPLRRAPVSEYQVSESQAGEWQAGKRTYTTADLLAILDTEPERLSPNALLRPVFQDTILPTASYIGGPAEIAYFAQSQVLYQSILSRTTPVFPRLSATLVDAPTAELMARHEITVADIYKYSADELAQRLGARSMPIEGKRKLAAAGNALDEELTALTTWMDALNPDLGRSAGVAASKMRYQMNRLRRLAANFQLQRDASLRRQVDALYMSLFPQRHPQERVIAGAWFLSRHGETLTTLLIEQASQQCPGHKVIYL